MFDSRYHSVRIDARDEQIAPPQALHPGMGFRLRYLELVKWPRQGLARFARFDRAGVAQRLGAWWRRAKLRRGMGPADPLRSIQPSAVPNRSISTLAEGICGGGSDSYSNPSRSCLHAGAFRNRRSLREESSYRGQARLSGAAQHFYGYCATTGNRKSAVFKHVVKAASAKGLNVDALTEQASSLAAELAATPVSVASRCIADDCTPEKLVTLLGDQGGRIAVLSPEGDVFDLMARRPSLSINRRLHSD
jgi:Protein of unknown function (DUF3987)